MEQINELLEKYFRAETTPDEEKKLKEYFSSGNPAPEHVSYSYLFMAYKNELEEKAVDPLKKVLSHQKHAKKVWIRTFSYSGMAAAIALALWIQRPQPSEDYAIIMGKRIDDSEYAQKYVEKKMDKVNNILRSSMEPMQSLNVVSEGLTPIKKISETKEKLDNIVNKIQL